MSANDHQSIMHDLHLLERLVMPALKDKSFLEIGCGTGFFCGYAWFEGARASLGLAFHENELEIARARFPSCAFELFTGGFAKSISRSEGFDIILCSAFPGSGDIESILPVLMSKLNRGGTLITRLAVTASPTAEETSGKEPATFLYISQQELERMLSDYVYKDMGSCDKSSERAHVFHIKNRSPYAILLMGESGSGKTTVAKQLFPNLPVVHGDELMLELAQLEPGSLKETYPNLDGICFGNKNLMGVGGIMIQIFNSVAGKQYARLVASLGNGKDFVYEGVIHANFQHVFVTQLGKLGYTVLNVGLTPPEQGPNYLFKHARDEARKYQLYLNACSGTN